MLCQKVQSALINRFIISTKVIRDEYSSKLIICHIFLMWRIQSSAKAAIDMQDLGPKQHLHRSLSAQSACLSSQQGKHHGTKVCSINRWLALFFQSRDTDGEALVFFATPEPSSHPKLPYVFANPPPNPPFGVPLIEYSEYWATVSIIHRLPGRPDWIHRQNSH